MKITENFLTAVSGFSPSGGVLVALSGGADSVCLLNLFISAKKSGAFPYRIAAAHLNHSLRGEEADRDEAFCKSICEKCGIELFVKKLDIASIAKEKGLCTEEAARDERYAFFADILADSPDLEFVATAHNKDDFCETMILNLIRGSGIDGLCSIPRKRGNIIRPLLGISRAEILDYISENSLSFVTDSTNLETEYTRNKVRHNIMPHFAEISPAYLDCIERSAKLLRADADFIAGEAKKAYCNCVNGGVLDTKAAQKLHTSLLSRILKMLYNEGGFSSLEEVHVDAICRQIASGKENFTLSLHASRCVCERGKLFFTNETGAKEFAFAVEFEKEIELPNGICVKLSKIKQDGAQKLLWAGGDLIIRSRREGDTMRIFGKTHKVKRLISDKKLSGNEKDKLFFLTSNEEIIYTNIPAISDAAFTKKDGENCIYIYTKETL